MRFKVGNHLLHLEWQGFRNSMALDPGCILKSSESFLKNITAPPQNNQIRISSDDSECRARVKNHRFNAHLTEEETEPRRVRCLRLDPHIQKAKAVNRQREIVNNLK